MLAGLFALRSSFRKATTLEVSLGAYSLAMASAKILSVFIVISPQKNGSAFADDPILNDLRRKENDTVWGSCRFQPLRVRFGFRLMASSRRKSANNAVFTGSNMSHFPSW